MPAKESNAEAAPASVAVKGAGEAAVSTAAAGTGSQGSGSKAPPAAEAIKEDKAATPPIDADHPDVRKALEHLREKQTTKLRELAAAAAPVGDSDAEEDEPHVTFAPDTKPPPEDGGWKVAGKKGKARGRGSGR